MERTGPSLNVPNYWLMGTDYCVTVIFDINIIIGGVLSKWKLNDNIITK